MIPAIAAAINDPSRRARSTPVRQQVDQEGSPLVMNEFSGDINGLMTFW
jgi:hypothetical protein